MKRRFFFLMIMFLPASLFAQLNGDSLLRSIPITSPGSSAQAYTYSCSFSVVDSATYAKNLMVMHQQQKVKRDTAKAITISRDSIHQDNKIVGYFQFSSGACYVYTPNGHLMATAGSAADKQWNIQSVSDRKIHRLISVGFFEEDIATFLIKQGYL